MIKLSFSELSAHEAIELTECYKAMKSGQTPDTVAAVTEEPTVTETVTPVSDDVDANGVKWMDEFHSSNKTKKADGTWKLKKGYNKAAYEAFLNGDTPSVPVAPVAPEPMMQPPVPNPAAPAVAIIDYNSFATLFSNLYQQGKITDVEINRIYAETATSDPAEYVTDDAKRQKAYELLLQHQ